MDVPSQAKSPMNRETDVVPIEHETFERVVRAVVTGAPLAALVWTRLDGVGRHPELA